VFWVISVYFNIRNTLPKFGPFLLWHPVYYIISTLCLWWLFCRIQWRNNCNANISLRCCRGQITIWSAEIFSPPQGGLCCLQSVIKWNVAIFHRTRLCLLNFIGCFALICISFMDAECQGKVGNTIRMRVTWILVIRQTLKIQTLHASLTALVRKFSCYTRVVNTSHMEQSQEPDGLRSSHSRNPSHHLLLNKKFHRPIHKSWLLNEIPIQDDSVSIFIHSFRKIHFNIIILFKPWSFKWPLPLNFWSNRLVRFPTCFMPATFNSYLSLLFKTIPLRTPHSESL